VGSKLPDAGRDQSTLLPNQRMKLAADGRLREGAVLSAAPAALRIWAGGAGTSHPGSVCTIATTDDWYRDINRSTSIRTSSSVFAHLVEGSG
jgi:hypothetical protein